MLTVDYDRLAIQPRERVLDVGCGEGRHTFEAVCRGAHVVSLDLDPAGLRTTAGGAFDLGPPASHNAVQGDANRLPFADRNFDVVMCAETLEHISTDTQAIAELARVLRPGGRLVVTVPRAWPERICWWLSRDYREAAGGHVRIYRASELRDLVQRAGFALTGGHHAHALHSPYWWLRCAFGEPERSRLTRMYQRLLEWDIINAPTFVGRLERLLNPVLGKSVVLYFERLDAATTDETRMSAGTHVGRRQHALT